MSAEEMTTLTVSEAIQEQQVALEGRPFWCGLGALKWYFCEFSCDNSHKTFTVYLLILFASWGIYIAAFTFAYFFYAMLAGCLLGFLMSIYAIPKIKDIMTMRKALRDLVKANISLHAVHADFANNINSVSKAHGKLDEIQSAINETHGKLKNSYGQFSKHGNNLNAKNVQSLEKLKELKYHFEECQSNYQSLLMRAERSTLNVLYQQIQKKDGKPGLSRAEFMEFIQKLPRHYKRRFVPLNDTFTKYAGDDENMDYKEFQIMITNVAREEALGQ